MQNAILLSKFSVPLPDIVLAKPRKTYYGDKHIAPEDIYLVIEISDSSLRYDRDRKMPLYAKAGVPELWIENLRNDVILVYRDPGADKYKTGLTRHRGEACMIGAFPKIPFTVEELLG